MIDYLEQESGQADALEEQRRRMAAALTSAAAGESGELEQGEAERTARMVLDDDLGETAKHESLPAEEDQKAKETLPLLEETTRLDRALDSAQGERADLLAARARGESWQTGRAGAFRCEQLGSGDGRNTPAFGDGTVLEPCRSFPH